MMKIVAGTALVLSAAAITAGCVAQGGVVGSSDQYSAAVNADRLCNWTHHSNLEASDGPPFGSRGTTRCGTNRQTYNTCDVVLWANPTGAYRIQNVTHGVNSCDSLAHTTAQNCPQYCYQARGAEFIFHIRLDNPNRRWQQGFVSGDSPGYCDKFFNENGQHILRCVHIQGAPPQYPRLLRSGQRAALRKACLGQLMSAKCTRASTNAYKHVDRKAMKRHLDEIEAGVRP